MIYDLIIIGAGPAGLAASIYASRYKVKHAVIGQILGGLASEAFKVENYPGCQTASGLELMNRFLEQAKSYNPEIINQRANEIRKEKNFFVVRLDNEEEIKSKSLILACGTSRRRLAIPGEQEFWGKGVAFCATCDAPFYKNKVVAVVGGGDAALTAALLLAKHAKQVYLIHRRREYSGQVAWQEKVKAEPKIIKIFETNLREIRGNKVVKEIVLDKSYQGQNKLKVDGVFIEIGSLPAVDLAKKLGIELDEKNYIKVNRDCQTNIPGIWAAGDVTNLTTLKQILTAANQGAIAATSVYQYLQKNKK